MATNRPRSLQVYDPVLSNLARRYKPGGFIARSLLPQIPVSKLSGQYPIFTKAFWFQNDVDNLVVDRQPTKEIDFEWSTDTYLVEEYALKVGWTDLEADQALAELKFEQSKVEFLTHRMELAHEIRVAALLRKTTNGGGLNLGIATPTVKWDVAGPTPNIEDDVKTGVLAIYDKIGRLPNTIVIPYKVAYAMALNDDIRAILRQDATGQGVPFITLGSRIIPAVIHGMRVVIPEGGQVDANREGAATESISEIWSDNVRLLYNDPSASWGMPSCAYLLNHTPKRVTRYRTTDPDVNYVREGERYDLKVVAPDAGYEIADVLT